MKKKIIGIIAAAAMLISVSVSASAAYDLRAQAHSTAAYSAETVREPGVGSHWTVVGLAGGDYVLPEGYMEDYYESMLEYTESVGGVFSKSKYTEYSAAVLGITAAGYDASDVGGYDLTAPLSDTAKVKAQGVNGPVFALLALDSGNYETEARDEYVDYILASRTSDGGWTYFGDTADADMTSMALQALAGYTDRADVAEAIDKAVLLLSSMQEENGGYTSWGVESPESTAQVIVALTTLGISVDDARFVKSGGGLLDALCRFGNGDGSFHSGYDIGANAYSTEQALLGLTAVMRQADGIGSIYDMDEDYTAVRFSDIRGHWAEDGILAAVEAGIFNGTSASEFSPEQEMSIAMMATALWRLDGSPVSDKAVGERYYYTDAIFWAEGVGILGASDLEGERVHESVTREKMALMLYNYAEYKGCDVSASADISAYSDFSKVSEGAANAIEWAVAEGIINGYTADTLLPEGTATRAQAAVLIMRFDGAVK